MSLGYEPPEVSMDELEQRTLDWVWKGAAELEQFLRPIESVEDHEKNARRGDVIALTVSLERFGQVRPILIDDSVNTIIAGHHLRKAARELGWTHMAMVPHVFENDADRIAYLIADNAIADRAGYDQQAQATFLEDQMAQGNLTGTGVDADYIDDLKASWGAVQETEPVEWQGGFAESAEAQAARAAAIGQATPKKEVGPFMVEPEEYEALGRWIRILMPHYGTSGTTATILRAVENEAARASGVGVPEPAEGFDGEHVIGVFKGMFGEPDAQVSWKAECACGEIALFFSEDLAKEWACPQS